MVAFDVMNRWSNFSRNMDQLKNYKAKKLCFPIS